MDLRLFPNEINVKQNSIAFVSPAFNGQVFSILENTIFTFQI